MKELWSAIQLTCRNLSMPMTWFHFIFIWFYEFHGNKMFYKVLIDFITCPFKPYTGKLQSWKSRIWHVNNLSVNTKHLYLLFAKFVPSMHCKSSGFIIRKTDLSLFFRHINIFMKHIYWIGNLNPNTSSQPVIKLNPKK